MAKASLAKGLSYLIAAQFQAVGLVAAAWWAGNWLNEHYPKGWSWYAVTFPLAVLAVFQTFYVIVRQLIRDSNTSNGDKSTAAHTDDGTT